MFIYLFSIEVLNNNVLSKQTALSPQIMIMKNISTYRLVNV